MTGHLKKSRYIAVPIPLKNQEITVYASPTVAEAFQHVSMNLNLFKAVKLTQLLEAVYEQGRKDGARVAIDAIDVHLEQAKRTVSYKNPGRPKKKRQFNKK